MNKKTDEVYVALLKAKESVMNYTNKKVKNENWRLYYNDIIKKLDDMISDYGITTKMAYEEILDCLFEVGADYKNSVFHDTYNYIKMNL